jgi:GTP-binding protein Era
MVELFVKSRRAIPTILALNKIDLVDPNMLAEHKKAFQELMPSSEVLPISALRKEHLDSLLQMIVDALPEAPAFFPDDQLTDTYERDIAADLIREAVLFNLRAEVPHSIAVRIDEYKERDDQMTYIAATLFVERDSQKGIVIGQGGTMLKKIGTAAREEIESISGRKIYLRLRVKVRKNWRNDEAALRLFGFRNQA